jgi:small subunit ribosomal protein S16
MQTGAQPTDTTRNILSGEGVLMKKHLLEGVKKGAFDEAQAEIRFAAWKNSKEGQTNKTKEQIAAEKAADAKSRLAAEKEVNKTKAAELAKKLAVAKAAEAEAEIPVVAVTEAPAVEAEVVTEVEAPAEIKETPAAE